MWKPEKSPGNNNKKQEKSNINLKQEEKEIMLARNLTTDLQLRKEIRKTIYLVFCVGLLVGFTLGIFI
jgi:hypothetical protein